MTITVAPKALEAAVAALDPFMDNVTEDGQQRMAEAAVGAYLAASPSMGVRAAVLGSDDDLGSVAHALDIGGIGTPYRAYQGAVYCDYQSHRVADFQDYGLALAATVLFNNAKAIKAALVSHPTPSGDSQASLPVGDEGQPTEPMYLIRKSGAYYRPNSHGYTGNVAEAGRYTLAEAEAITHPNGPDGPRDNMSYELAPPALPHQSREEIIAGWQPIETAPKDGTRILFCNAFSDSPGWPVVAEWRSDRFWHDGRAVSFSTHGAGSPTHWMPLPAPPARDLKGE